MKESNDITTRKSRRHPLIGSTLGQYEFIEAIGNGSSGTVLKAKDRLRGGFVAVKLISHETDPVSVARLAREAEILTLLDHPNIVKTVDFLTAPTGHKVLVMDHIEGESLSGILEREILLPVIRATTVFIQIADALHFAHAKGVLHRDIKPHNIILATSPENLDLVKILDFGIAKLKEDNQQLTRTGEVLGSPLYMSPEQCDGEEIDERSDIYSLGVLMFQCMTGSVPFKGSTAMETLKLKSSASPPQFKELAPGILCPSKLEKLIRDCLAVDKENRPSSMRSVKVELEQILLGLKDPSKLPQKDPAKRSYTSLPSTTRQTLESFVSSSIKAEAQNQPGNNDFKLSRKDGLDNRSRIATRNILILVLLIALAIGLVAWLSTSWLMGQNTSQNNISDEISEKDLLESDDKVETTLEDTIEQESTELDKASFEAHPQPGHSIDKPSESPKRQKRKKRASAGNEAKPRPRRAYSTWDSHYRKN